MTTLVGIKTKEGVVLASDVAWTSEEWEQHGDIAVRRKSITPDRKIYVSGDEMLAVCMTGLRDDHYQDLLHDMVRNSGLDMAKRISDSDFPELRDLHVFRRNKRGSWNTQLESYLLIAARYDCKPNIYVAEPLGKIEPVNGYGIQAKGSGEQHANAFLSRELASRAYEKGFLSVKHYLATISTYDAALLAKGAVEAGSRDPHTSGWDSIAMTPKGVVKIGDWYRDKMRAAEKAVMSEGKKLLEEAVNEE